MKTTKKVVKVGPETPDLIMMFKQMPDADLTVMRRRLEDTLRKDKSALVVFLAVLAENESIKYKDLIE